MKDDTSRFPCEVGCLPRFLTPRHCLPADITDFSRVTIELHIIALGSILRTWGVGQRDVLSVLQWFVQMWVFLACRPCAKTDCLLWTGLESSQTLRRRSCSAIPATERQSTKSYLMANVAPRNTLASPRTLVTIFRVGERFHPAVAVDEERVIAYLRTLDMGTATTTATPTYVLIECNTSFQMATCECMTAVPYTCASVKRIIGNIGRTGIWLLAAPFEPKIRPLGNEYNVVEHAAYEGKRKDSFKGTS